MTGLESVSDGAFLREACWHSAGLAFLPQAKAAGEAHAYARMVDSGHGSTLPQHYLDDQSTGAKLWRPARERTGPVSSTRAMFCCGRMVVTWMERAPWLASGSSWGGGAGG